MLRFLLFLALVLPVSAQETMIREVFDPATDTHLEVLALFSKPSPGGYFPVRVKIANNLRTDRTIHLDFESSNDSGDDLKAKSSFPITAAAGKSVTRDILVPLTPPGTGSGNTSVTALLSGTLGMATNTIRSNSDGTQPAVLLSEALFTPNASVLDAAMGSTSSSGMRRGSSQFSGKFDPKQLPDDWLAFSGYDSVVLTDSDWSDIPPGARNAVLSWVRMGGQLIIYSSGSATAAAMGLPAEPGFGRIEFRSIPSDLKLDAPDVVRLVTKNPTKPQQVSARNDFDGGWPLQRLFGAQTFRYALFVIVLILFAILVGPVNLFVFAKSGQRHKLFITTPIISLGASLVLIVLIIVQDGFGGNGMRRVLMEVRPDEGVNAAYLHQEQFCRTGVLTGSDFTIAPAADFQPVPIATSRWARYTDGVGAKGNFNLQPAEGNLMASGDWFQSRSEHGHLLSAVTSTRGRIERDESRYLSTFEFPIDTLYYLDEASQWHRAEGITAGKRFALVPVENSSALSKLIVEADAFANRNKQFLKTAIPRPGHFIAITTHAPGIATNPGIRWKETRTVITGPVVSP
ncbi:MAG: hypothetical protein V4819_16575 [Verrucomicrobiota bacterium]